MTSERRFEQDLPDLLAQLALGPTPAYRDQIVQQTARMRQRPAWMFPERWLPMSTLTSRMATAPRMPIRILALIALLLIALAVGALLIVGSQQRLPAPFGLAANGHVAYANAGDIYTVNPVSGTATAVVTGAETDLGPVWSRDGTRSFFVFERKALGGSGLSQLFVASSDGRGQVAVTPNPVAGLYSYAFSPNGQEIMYTLGTQASSRLWIAKADGTGVRALDVGMNISDTAFYRPPDGAEILFAGDKGQNAGLYAVNVETSVVRPIVASYTEGIPGLSVPPQIDFGSGSPWSPDGSRIAFTKWQFDEGGPNNARIHVVRADGTGDRALPLPPGAMWSDGASWSNSGSRLALIMGYSAQNADAVLAVIPVDGAAVSVETNLAPMVAGIWCCPSSEWAPDDTSILVTPVDSTGRAQPQVLWDPLTGQSKPAPWTATSKPAWQRRAP